ncbi:MAG: hypothetical protein AAB620_00315, partial [Patescibacteria group bacterium]
IRIIIIRPAKPIRIPDNRFGLIQHGILSATRNRNQSLPLLSLQQTKSTALNPTRAPNIPFLIMAFIFYPSILRYVKNLKLKSKLRFATLSYQLGAAEATLIAPCALPVDKFGFGRG